MTVFQYFKYNFFSNNLRFLLCADVVAYQVRLGGIYVDARRQGPGLLDLINIQSCICFILENSK